MKTTRFLSVVFVLVSSLFADTISLRNGQEIKDAVVTEIGDSDVKYKIGQRATVYIAKKADIAFIIYDDGTKDIFNPVSAAKTAESEEKWKKFFGIRVAYNSAHTTDIPDSDWGRHSSLTPSELSESGPGAYSDIGEYGFTIGVISNYQLSSNMAIHAEGNFIYRSTVPNWLPILQTCPSDVSNLDCMIYENVWWGFGTIVERGNVSKEFAIATNVLLHLLPFGGPIFYLEGGFQLGSSLFIWDNIDFDTEIPIPYWWTKRPYTRSILDFGPAFGFGWHINENFMLGLRGVVYLNDTYKEVKGSLIQEEFGLSYIF